MKIRAAIPLVLSLSMLATHAFARTPQTSTDPQAGKPAATTPGAQANSTVPSKIDPAKEAAIRQLLDQVGGVTAIKQVIDGMQGNMKTVLTNTLPPGDYRAKLIDLFLEKFRSAVASNSQQFLDQAVQAYDKYLSLDDIKGLTQFYATPLGQKTLHVLPQMTVEMQTAGMQWGQTVGRQAMIDVLKEHPELAQELEAAQKSAHPQ
jgi:hypothetical protein